MNRNLQLLRVAQRLLPTSFGMKLGNAFVRAGLAGRHAEGLAYFAPTARLIGKRHTFTTPYLYGGSELRAVTGAITLGSAVRLHMNVLLSAHQGGTIDVGDRTYIGPHGVLLSVSTMRIGRDCLIGPHCGIFAESHQTALDRPFNQQPLIGRGITIGDNVFIGNGTTILDGVTIGESAIVAAGSVVRTSVPARTLVAGIPARFVRTLT